MSSPDEITYDSNGNIIAPSYGYLPTKSVCFIFLGLFGVSTLLHVGQAIHRRAWWLLPTVVLAGLGEAIGWSGRLWSSYVPLNHDAYIMQIVCLIIAPTPLVGAVFISFGRLSNRLGEHYSRLSASLYSRVFITCDIIALVVQSVGGGIAASADEDNLVNLGSNIMLAGIVFQLVSLTIFSILMAEYFYRYVKNSPRRPILLNNNSTEAILREKHSQQPMERSLKLLIAGICLETFFLFIRSIYRTIELADGFHGKIIHIQIYFNIFDGVMVVLAIYTMNFLNPANLLHHFDVKYRQSMQNSVSMETV